MRIALGEVPSLPGEKKLQARGAVVEPDGRVAHEKRIESPSKPGQPETALSISNSWSSRPPAKSIRIALHETYRGVLKAATDREVTQSQKGNTALVANCRREILSCRCRRPPGEKAICGRWIDGWCLYGRPSMPNTFKTPQHALEGLGTNTDK